MDVISIQSLHILLFLLLAIPSFAQMPVEENDLPHEVDSAGTHTVSGIFDSTLIPCDATRLDTRLDLPASIRALPATAPRKYLDFRGLLVHEHLVREVFPLLTYLFFDQGSAHIPDRYILFTEPSQTERFSDTSIPGGTLQKYYHLLNIIGYRMKQHPETRIQIVGCNSKEPDQGETLETSGQRAEAVHEYLLTIWGIEPGRIKLLAPRDLPEQLSNIRDPQGLVENRRVEIRSDDWELVKPVVDVQLHRDAEPTTMSFVLNNGIDSNLVQRRAIEIRRNGQFWHAIRDLGTTDSLWSYNWGKRGVADSLPADTGAYTAQLVVYTRDSLPCRSPQIELPVIITSGPLSPALTSRRDSTRVVYSLIMFRFNSSEPGALNDRILREFIYGDIRSDSRVDITGYAPYRPGSEWESRLTESRARSVGGRIRRRLGRGGYSSISESAAQVILYSPEIPEGRFYDRTVRVSITTPPVIGE